MLKISSNNDSHESSVSLVSNEQNKLVTPVVNGPTNNNFENLNLSEDLLKGVYLYGFINPSKIQIKGINTINTGYDCIIQSQSGTGKTATYLLGIFNHLDKNTFCQGIIITPTRELANQVFNVGINLNIAITTAEIGNMIRGKAVFKMSRCPAVIDLTPPVNELATK